MFHTTKSNRIVASLLTALTFFFLFTSAVAADSQLGNALVSAEETRLFAGVKDPAEAVFERLSVERKALENGNNTRNLDAWLDQVRTLNHQVPVGNGYSLAVTETFTLRSWLRHHHRAVVFLPGSSFRGNHFNIPVDGYDSGAIVAQHQGFAFAVDYIGVGDSTRPTNGRVATFELQREAVRTLIHYIRHFRAVPKVDLIGDGFGGAIAYELAADGARVRSATASAMLYREVGPASPLADPGFVGLLEGSPDGYFFLPGEASLFFMVDAPQAARDYVAATQGGFYPVDNFLVATQRPFFDPTRARAPGLLLYGSRDLIGVPADITNLAAEYGRSGATLVVNPNAGHAPRAEGPEIAAWYWSTVLDFLDL